MGQVALVGSVILAVAVSQAPADRASDFTKLTVEELKAGIEKQHPAAYYVLAKKLFQGGAQDEAVFWFYAGQLRYRLHLAAIPELPKSGDPALFGSLSEVIGAPLNEYAFGDLAQLVETIDKVLAWDEKTDNGFTSKTRNDAEWTSIRDGLRKMRAYVLQNGDAIRADRTKNGLPNRRPKVARLIA
jgi:hypothetical protein